jgi:hypothetical protein
MRRNCIVRTGLICSACALCAVGAPARADDTATASAVAIATDMPLEFDASGPFFTIDDDGVVPPATKTIDGATELLVDGTNWDFWLSHEVLDWMPPAGGPGADDAMICIRGEHSVAPHAGEAAPNPLGRVCGPPFGGEDIGFGPPGVVRLVSGRAAHGAHFDHYAVRTDYDAVMDVPPGTAHRLGGDTRIQAVHTENRKHSFRWSEAAGTSASSGTRVSYDAALGQLSFSVGPIDILDGDGGRTGAVDPIYAGDPVLGAQLAVSTLQFLGVLPDGRYRFSGGTLAITDPGGGFELQGRFSEYLIASTMQDEPLTSFALMDRIDGFGAPALPPFLETFTNTHLMRDGVSPQLNLKIQGVDFAFVTAVDLVAMTAGFTVSAQNVPATIYCTGNSVVDPNAEVPALPVVAGALLAVTIALAGTLALRGRLTA